mmetsp:Transcript_55484/g.156163  ORF Transcript_55484/g.156163 Transcript_55484/m.156163 type:complete len:320 (+) Transcript_55484:81-1040(+)
MATWEVLPTCGVEVRGLTLQDISDKDMDEVRRQFADHGVVFFRNIGGAGGEQITKEAHVSFAQKLGSININRFFPSVDGFPAIAKVEKTPEQAFAIGDTFHADHTYDLAPAMGSMLLARSLPASGGDTLFVSMYKAYDSLPEGLKRQLEGLRAVHSRRHAFEMGLQGTTQDTLHPVVIAHPESGRRALFVNPSFTIHFEGKTIDESMPLLGTLYRHALQARHMHRLRHEAGSAVLWDNRAVWHCAMNDYQGEYRLMHRLTIGGVKLSAAHGALGSEAVDSGEDASQNPAFIKAAVFDTLEYGLAQLGVTSWFKPLPAKL